MHNSDTCSVLPRTKLLLRKEHPRKLFGLLETIRDTRAFTLLGPGIVEVQVLLELAIHEDMWNAEDCAHDVAV